MNRILFLLLIAAAGTPLIALGAESQSFVPLTSLPGIKDFSGQSSLPNLLNNIYKIAIGAAAVLAVLQIMRAGILYMGGDSVTEKKEAKNLLGMSIGGLLLVLSPVIVFSIINPKILELQIGTIDLNELGSPSAKQGGDATSVPAQCSQYTSKTVGSACNASTGYSEIAPTCCPELLEGNVCCGKSAIIEGLENAKVVPLLDEALGGVGTDPELACYVAAGPNFVPGTGCGVLPPDRACCVLKK